MVHIQIYGHIPFFFILGRGLFQCPRKTIQPLFFMLFCSFGKTIFLCNLLGTKIVRPSDRIPLFMDRKCLLEE